MIKSFNKHRTLTDYTVTRNLQMICLSYKCAVACSPRPFAVDGSDDIPHGDDGTTTGCCHVCKQFKVRQERTGKVWRDAGIVASQFAVVVCAWKEMV